MYISIKQRNYMNPRIVLFYIGCMGTRALLALWAQNPSETSRTVLTFLLTVIAIGFASIYLFGWRKNAQETFGETNVVWWNDLRPVHAFLYASTAWLLYTRNEQAHLPLILDLWIGFAATTKQNFKRIGV
jgi:hypothetical protein